MTESPTRTAWDRWHRSTKPIARRFGAALTEPEAAQAKYLGRLLKAAEGTVWAETYGIDPGIDVEGFRARAPILSPEDLAGWTGRIVAGESSVLTGHPVERLVPTSGTTGPSKLIPMTESSRNEYAGAVDLWIHECLRQCPSIKEGRAYIATSPAFNVEANIQSAVPVGFAGDAAYLGPVPRSELHRILVVPGEVAALRGAAWQNATRGSLLRAPDLRFLSIWHPTYMNALFSEKELCDLARRWPELELISCWADGATRESSQWLRRKFPDARFQPKGLWLTEGAVSLPWNGRHPVALLSGFFEFECENGDIRLTHELEPGLICRPLITNHAGLYRYRLGDTVRVDGFIGATPSIRWIGRADEVSDLCGEKLSEAHIAEALDSLRWTGFFLLLPHPNSLPPRYVCLVDASEEKNFPINHFIDALRSNPHYAWARNIGQLGPAQSMTIDSLQRKQILDILRAGSGYHAKIGFLVPPALRNDVASVIGLASVRKTEE